MLYVIGLGLGDEVITIRGLEAIQKCDKIYMEAYTSLLSFGLSPHGLSTLEELYGKPITVADREMVEEKADQILSGSISSDVAFLVFGDRFGCIGMGRLYRFRFFTENWRPDSFDEKIKSNRELGLHTLCLLDIRVEEPTWESLSRRKKQYEPPRFMTINKAIKQLLEVEQNLVRSAYNENTDCVGLARLGNEDQIIAAGTMKQLLDVDFGSPLHCLVIVGKTHPLEEEMLEIYRLKK